MSASSNPAASADQRGGSLRVLFSCIGRRVELLRAFRRAGEGLGCALEVHAAEDSGSVHRLALPPLACDHQPRCLPIDPRPIIPMVISSKGRYGKGCQNFFNWLLCIVNICRSNDSKYIITYSEIRGPKMSFTPVRT